MVDLNTFSQWMSENTKLSDSSIYKYSRAVVNVSKEMNACGVISDDILSMGIISLDIAIKSILGSSEFIAKDKKGNRMYSIALKQYRCFISGLDTEQRNANAFDVDTMIESNITDTERESIIKSRIGQGVFRDKLIKKYSGKCLITGLTINKCLIASHIKPWAVCNNDERLSEENGLLLSATYDRLFDSGLISFNNTGKIVISTFIDDTNRKILNITPDIKINIIPGVELTHNLEYHRDVVFVK
ncbi:MAG: HNH endonuclease [Ruminiclostridium sp.]|nr:HNH endonuclease [Ruminiclostridium sp.]